MELDITEFFIRAAPMDYSASIAEIGRNAGPDTWRAACEDSADYPLLDTDEKRKEFRRFVKGFGTWDEAHIAAWSDTELNALCIQFISGDMREAGLSADTSDEEWAAYEADGNRTRRIYRGDDGRIYFYIGD